ncbi:MAG: (2Fe-2S)-binding protein, partial [Duodenibacillus sp.]|nr:(2Fe-2S)-binding protein [Duodenibacillus sp.]
MKAWINGREVEFTSGETILSAARRAGVYIPTLCAFLPLDHKPGTCRMCLVEVSEGGAPARVLTACTTPLAPGMRVLTRSKRVREMQRTQLSWIFADHSQDCGACARRGDCELIDAALAVGLRPGVPPGRYAAARPVDATAPALVLDAGKCIRCGRCVELCRSVQGVSALAMDGTGPASAAGVAGALRWADSARCVQCGQCTLVCPTGALAARDDAETALDWFDDPEIKTVVAFAPAVRVTLGEEFGLRVGANAEGKIVAALKRLGADWVCDVNWAADVTVMEEGAELLGRLAGGGALPM